MPDELLTVTDIAFITFFEGSQAKGEALTAMDALTNRLIQEFGEPSTNNTLSNRYWGNENVEEALTESQFLKDQWEINEVTIQNGLNIILQTRLAKAGAMYTLTIQYSVTLQ